MFGYALTAAIFYAQSVATCSAMFRQGHVLYWVQMSLLHARVASFYFISCGVSVVSVVSVVPVVERSRNQRSRNQRSRNQRSRTAAFSLVEFDVNSNN